VLSVKSPQFSNCPYAKCHFINPSLTGFGLTEPAVAASIPYYESKSRLSREGDKTDKLLTKPLNLIEPDRHIPFGLLGMEDFNRNCVSDPLREQVRKILRFNSEWVHL